MRMEHNFLPHPHYEEKCIIQICDNPFACDKCSEMIRNINKIRLTDFMKTINSDDEVYSMSSRILPTDFYINFQNFTTIENLIYVMCEKTNLKIKNAIKSTKILIVSYLEESLYYTYPILNIDFYFFGTLNSDAIRFLTDIGRNSFPLQTGDIGMFEKIDKTIAEIEGDITYLLEAEPLDLSPLFDDKTQNIYGTQNLKNQIQYLAIFHIHQVELDDGGECVIPNFLNHSTNNPMLNAPDEDLEF